MYVRRPYGRRVPKSITAFSYLCSKMEGVNKVGSLGEDFVFVYWDQYDPGDSQESKEGAE